jgi:hypothetical protein
MKVVEPENDGHDDIWHKKDLKNFYKFTQQPSPVARSPPVRSPHFDSEVSSNMPPQSILKPRDHEIRNSRQQD